MMLPRGFGLMLRNSATLPPLANLMTSLANRRIALALQCNSHGGEA